MENSRSRNLFLGGLAIIAIAALSIFVVPRAQASDAFPDVPDSHWAHDFVTWLFDNAITSGYPDGTYRPDNLVTRAEMAVFLQQAALVPWPTEQLVVDWVQIFITPGGSNSLAKGERNYGEFDLFAEGTVGTEARIGEGKWDLVSTTDVGTFGWYESETFHIFGQGVIEIVGVGPPWEGAIVGGTGDFAGASGEYSTECGFEGVCRITLTFTKPPKPAK